ncbi:MAG: hypothetical protein PHZ25_00555 [Candidatus Pacebacteria bacterium]|nr:hypothetical protein [Candidatus Paceibacterota bacterium]
MDEQKKFSLSETIILILVCLFADTVELLSYAFSLIPPLAPFSVFFVWIINTFVFGFAYLWLIIKGARGAWFLAGSLVEYIPFLNLLPIKTVTIIVAIVLSNNPVLKKTTEIASKKLGGKDDKKETADNKDTNNKKEKN